MFCVFFHHQNLQIQEHIIIKQSVYTMLTNENQPNNELIQEESNYPKVSNSLQDDDDEADKFKLEVPSPKTESPLPNL